SLQRNRGRGPRNRARDQAQALRNDRLAHRTADGRAGRDEEGNRRGGQSQPVRLWARAGGRRNRRGAPGEVRMPTMKPSTRSKKERGAALLEAAITIPMLLLVSVGIFEFGRAYQTWQILTNAAREGARLAVLPDPTPGVVESRVLQYMRDG